MLLCVRFAGALRAECRLPLYKREAKGEKAMLRSTTATLQSLKGVSPWSRRPMGLHGGSLPPFLTRGQLAKARRFNDPSRVSHRSHLILKKCPHCTRSQMFPIEQRHYFHTCCEQFEMKETGSVAEAMKLHMGLQDEVRRWDFASMKPKCNPSRPKPKGRSKVAK